MKSKSVRSSLALLLVLLLWAGSLAAQEEEPSLELRLRRDFGYGSGLQMQGRFSLRVEAPPEVERVEFLLDGTPLGVDREAPFSLRFNTDDYEDGWHTLEAVGYTAGGTRLASNAIRREFVPAAQSWLTMLGIFGLVAVGLAVRFLMTRNREAENYDLVGGAICPHCGRPFAYHIWSANLVAGRVDRCRHCGKWSFTQRKSPNQLREIEATFEEDALPAEPATTEAERLRRQLESSRYEDLP